MAASQNLRPLSFPTSADLSTKLGMLVTLNASTEAALQTTNGGAVLGPITDEPSTDASVIPVAQPGSVAKVRASSTGGTAITRLGPLKSSTQGKAVLAASAGDYVFGHALNALSTGKDQFIRALLTHAGQLSS